MARLIGSVRNMPGKKSRRKNGQKYSLRDPKGKL
jgi:hypothetical protein